jgi:hypothetical protein
MGLRWYPLPRSRRTAHRGLDRQRCDLPGVVAALPMPDWPLTGRVTPCRQNQTGVSSPLDRSRGTGRPFEAAVPFLGKRGIPILAHKGGKSRKSKSLKYGGDFSKVIIRTCLH